MHKFTKERGNKMSEHNNKDESNDFVREYAKRYNLYAIGDMDFKPVEDFILSNKERVNRVELLIIFISSIRIEKDFFSKHFDYCKVFYDYMINDEDYEEKIDSFSLFIRLGFFQETFEDYLKEHSSLTRVDF